jgi:hypothetical protein
MSHWEYNVIAYEPDTGFFSLGGKVDPADMRERLNQLGREGWELVSSFDTAFGKGATRNVVFVFKRIIELA